MLPSMYGITKTITLVIRGTNILLTYIFPAHSLDPKNVFKQTLLFFN